MKRPGLAACLTSLLALSGCYHTEPLPSGCYYGRDPRPDSVGRVAVLQVEGTHARIVFPGTVREVELVRVHPLWQKSYVLSRPSLLLSYDEDANFREVIEKNVSDVDMPLKDGPRPSFGIPWSPTGYWDVTLERSGAACPMSRPPSRQPKSPLEPAE